MTPGWGDLVQLFAARAPYQVSNTIASGELALWDPYADCGAPTVGNIQNATFYPFSILFYIMPTHSAFGFIFLADTLLAGLFAYLFVRSFGLSRGAGLAGAITYMFSGIWTPKLYDGHIMVYNNFPWLVLGLYLVHKVALSARDRKWSAGVFFATLLGVTLAVQFCGGHAQFWIYSTFFVLAFAVFEIVCASVSLGGARPIGAAGLIAGACGLSLLIAMVQFLPMMEFAGQVLDEGKRPAAYASSGIFTNAESVMAIVPRYYGSIEQHSYWGYDPQWEVTPYVGILPLILLVSAPLIVRNRYAWYFCAAGVMAVLYAYGGSSPVFRLLVQVPGFSAFRFPVRMLTQALAAGVLLVGFSWDRLFTDRPGRSKWIPIVSGAIALALGAYMGAMYVSNGMQLEQMRTQWTQEVERMHNQFLLPAYQMSEAEAKAKADWNVSEVQRELFTGACICVVSAGLFVAARRRGRLRIACGVAALVIIAGDLMSFGMPYVRTLPVNNAKVYPEHTPLLDRLNGLAKDKPQFRICDFHSPIGSEMIYHQFRRREFNMVAGDLDSSKLKGYAEYMNYAKPDSDIRIINDIMSAFNVKYYVADRPMRDYQKESEQRAPAPDTAAPIFGDAVQVGDVYVTENLECLERAYVVNKVVPMAGETREDIMAFLAQRQVMTNLAVIEEPAEFTLNGKGGVQNAVITDYQPNHITVEASLDQPGFLVLSEAWYPDWRAYDAAEGGRTELHVYRTNVAMRGVFLKAGKHKVEFVYEPRSYYVGKMVTLVTIPVVLALLLISGIVARKAHD
jgi:hypothetical protein